MSSFGHSLTARARGLLCALPEPLMNHLPVLGRVRVRDPQGRAFYMRTHGKAGLDRIAWKLWRRGPHSYEPETLQVFQAMLQDARVFVDVGANTGLFSLMAAIDGSRRVIAFEPVPAIFSLLRANVQLNRLVNLTAEQLAVSDSVGDIDFYITRTRGGVATDSSSVAGFRAKVEKFVLKGITLDGYLKANNPGRVDLLKIDVESAEPSVLRGARQTIQRDRPIILCEVLDCVDREAIHAVMDPLNFCYFHITANGLIPHQRLQGSPGRGDRNYLFIPRERTEEVCRRCNAAHARAA
jgi:FkbM family methyltransferase